MTSIHGPAFQAALDMLLVPEAASEPVSEGHSCVTQNVENSNQDTTATSTCNLFIINLIQSNMCSINKSKLHKTSC